MQGIYIRYLVLPPSPVSQVTHGKQGYLRPLVWPGRTLQGFLSMYEKWIAIRDNPFVPIGTVITTYRLTRMQHDNFEMALIVGTYKPIWVYELEANFKQVDSN